VKVSSRVQWSSSGGLHCAEQFEEMEIHTDGCCEKDQHMAAGHRQGVNQHALAQPTRKVLQQPLVRAGLQLRCEGSA
jgi:hypothetical protein